MSLADYRRHERTSEASDRGIEWALDGSGAEVRLRVLRGGRPAQRRQFLRRAELWQGLAHTHIVPVREIGEESEGPYLVEDLPAGVDLTSIVALGRHEHPARIALLLQIVAALDFAHRQQVLHRGLAPAEVRVSSASVVTVAGFGVARLLTRAGADADMEALAVTAMARLAPERMLGGEADVASDVYAFGVLAHELLSGEFPFPTESPASLLAAKMQASPPTLEASCSECPEPVRELVASCMARAPQERPDDFAEIGRRLREASGIPEEEDAQPVGETTTGGEADVDGSEPPPPIQPVTTPVTTPATTPATTPVTAPVGTPLGTMVGRGQRWVVAHPRSSLALAALLVLAMIFGLLQSRDARSPDIEPAPSAVPIATESTAPGPVGLEAVGVLRVDARPWAEIVSIVRADGSPVPLPPLRYTPFSLRLPAGTYEVELRRPDRAEAARCAATVVDEAIVDCVVEFLSVSPQQYFREAGWWR